MRPGRWLYRGPRRRSEAAVEYGAGVDAGLGQLVPLPRLERGHGDRGTQRIRKRERVLLCQFTQHHPPQAALGQLQQLVAETVAPVGRLLRIADLDECLQQMGDGGLVETGSLPDFGEGDGIGVAEDVENGSSFAD